MTITISSSRETGVSAYEFARQKPKWREAARMEPGKPGTLDVETGEPALIVTWREVAEGYQVEQTTVARTWNQGVCGAKVRQPVTAFSFLRKKFSFLRT